MIEPKRWWIIKGEHRGDVGDERPFYSSILTKEEYEKSLDEWIKPQMFTPVVEASAYDALLQANEELTRLYNKAMQERKEIIQAKDNAIDLANAYKAAGAEIAKNFGG